MSELVLADGVGVVDLVSEDQEGDLGELLHGQESVKLGLGLGETLNVLGVNQEDDTADFGKVVLPQTTSWKKKSTSILTTLRKLQMSSSLTLLVTTQVESREPVVANNKLLRCCKENISQLIAYHDCVGVSKVQGMLLQ